MSTSFVERFKGRTEKVNKHGIKDIVAKSSLPIVKNEWIPMTHEAKHWGLYKLDDRLVDDVYSPIWKSTNQILKGFSTE